MFHAKESSKGNVPEKPRTYVFSANRRTEWLSARDLARLNQPIREDLIKVCNQWQSLNHMVLANRRLAGKIEAV